MEAKLLRASMASNSAHNYNSLESQKHTISPSSRIALSLRPTLGFSRSNIARYKCLALQASSSSSPASSPIGCEAAHRAVDREQQNAGVNTPRQSSLQTEDALTQGINKLHHTLAHSMASDPSTEGGFECQMASAVEKLEALESFVVQADHLRKQTMRHLSRILTPHQAARALLALGEFFHRLRALSSLWAARPREPA